ncbi:MAG TPA: peptidylprolyl isomerase [Bacillota bacterium]
MVGRKQILCCGLLIVMLTVGVSLGWRSLEINRRPPKPHPFGYRALKINGKYVEATVFQQEQRRFYDRWKRNGPMLRLSDEARNDLLLETVINRAVMEDYLRQQPGAEINLQVVRRYIDRYVKTHYPTEEAWQAYLKSVYCTDEAQLEQVVAVYLLQLKYFPAVAKKYGITVSPSELAQRDRSQREENRKAVIRHILIAPHDRTPRQAEQLARKVYQKLSTGLDFQAAVKSYSDDHQTKDQGGRLGPLTRNQVPPELVWKIFNAQPGQLFPPVNTKYGWEIVKVDRFIESGHPLSELRAMITVAKFMASKEYETWLQELKAVARIEITEPCFQAYRLSKAQKHHQAGQIYERLYHQYQAEFYLQRALESYLAAQNWKKLIELGQLGIKKHDNQVPYYLYAAEGFYRNRRRQEALKLLKKADKLAAGNLVLKNMTIQAYQKLGLESGLK